MVVLLFSFSYSSVTVFITLPDSRGVCYCWDGCKVGLLSL